MWTPMIGVEVTEPAKPAVPRCVEGPVAVVETFSKRACPPDEVLGCLRDVVDTPYVERHDLELRRVMQKLASLLTINHRSSRIGMELIMQEPERSEESLGWMVARTRPTTITKRFNRLCCQCHAIRRCSGLRIRGCHLQLFWRWGQSLLSVQCLCQGKKVRKQSPWQIWGKGVRPKRLSCWRSRSQAGQHPGSAEGKGSHGWWGGVTSLDLSGRWSKSAKASHRISRPADAVWKMQSVGCRNDQGDQAIFLTGRPGLLNDLLDERRQYLGGRWEAHWLQTLHCSIMISGESVCEPGWHELWSRGRKEARLPTTGVINSALLPVPSSSGWGQRPVSCCDMTIGFFASCWTPPTRRSWPRRWSVRQSNGHPGLDWALTNVAFYTGCDEPFHWVTILSTLRL